MEGSYLIVIVRVLEKTTPIAGSVLVRNVIRDGHIDVAILSKTIWSALASDVMARALILKCQIAISSA